MGKTGNQSTQQVTAQRMKTGLNKHTHWASKQARERERESTEGVTVLTEKNWTSQTNEDTIHVSINKLQIYDGGKKGFSACKR